MGRFGKNVEAVTGNVGRTAGAAADYEGGGSDALLLNQMVRTKLYYPSRDHELVMRPYPALDPVHSDSKFLRARAGTGEREQTDWIAVVATASFVGAGKDRVSFILYSPQQEEERKRTNPYTLLYWAAFRANKSGKWADGRDWKGSWNKLFSREGNASKPLSGPDYMAFMQGAVLAHGKNNYLLPSAKGKRKDPVPYGLGEEDALPICRIGKTTALSLLAYLDIRKEGSENETNINKMYQTDPIGFLGKEGNLVNGRILEFFKAGPKVTPGAECTWDGGAPTNGLGEYSWHTNLYREYAATAKTAPFSATLSAEHVQRIFQTAYFWYGYKADGKSHPGLLRIMDDEEQAAVIARAFKDVGGLVIKCWEEHDHLLTDEVQGILQSRVSAVVPGDDETSGEDETPAPVKPKTAAAKPKAGTKTPAAAKYEEPEEDDETFEEVDAADQGEVEEEEITEDQPEEDQEAGEVEEDPEADPEAEEEQEADPEAEEEAPVEDETTEEEVTEDYDPDAEVEADADAEEEEETTPEEEDDDFSTPAVSTADIERAKRAAAGADTRAAARKTPAGKAPTPPARPAAKPVAGKAPVKPAPGKAPVKPAAAPAKAPVKPAAAPAKAPVKPAPGKPVAGKPAPGKAPVKPAAAPVKKPPSGGTATRR